MLPRGDGRRAHPTTDPGALGPNALLWSHKLVGWSAIQAGPHRDDDCAIATMARTAWARGVHVIAALGNINGRAPQRQLRARQINHALTFNSPSLAGSGNFSS